jgi:hypothetical protein
MTEIGLCGTRLLDRNDEDLFLSLEHLSFEFVSDFTTWHGRPAIAD